MEVSMFVQETYERYVRQAHWTKGFREYLYRKFSPGSALRILEIGCGLGAVLECIRQEYGSNRPDLYGLDIDGYALKEAHSHTDAVLIRGEGEAVPLPDDTFDLVYCHYLLLWAASPINILREMRRVTKPEGICAAMAEPCYSEMTAEPESFALIAEKQAETLRKRGADTDSGAKLGLFFTGAGFETVETGKYTMNRMDPSELWFELLQMKTDCGLPDHAVPVSKNIKYNVPTYFAYAKK